MPSRHGSTALDSHNYCNRGGLTAFSICLLIVPSNFSQFSFLILRKVSESVMISKLSLPNMIFGAVYGRDFCAVLSRIPPLFSITLLFTVKRSQGGDLARAG